MLCDGVPVTMGNVAAYRQLFATVFTDYFLFECLPHPDERTLALAAYWMERLGLAPRSGWSRAVSAPPTFPPDSAGVWHWCRRLLNTGQS
ncbi:hypothetical protein H845_708 [Komagataeibacter xylinus E25]|nr:hypothetical protein H845_708 [Komagataeibacter xylinus E25]